MSSPSKRKGHRPGQTAQEAGTLSLLPMEIQIGDRFTEGEFEWEVVTHPAAFQGGKSLREYGDGHWRVTFYVTGHAHSIVGGTAWEPAAWTAVQRAAWDVLKAKD